MKQKRSSKKILAVSSLAVLLLGCAVAVVKGATHHQEEGAVVKVTRGTVKLSVQEVGSVEPLRKVDLKSKIAGQVSHVLVDVGQRVKAGDVLVRLDPIDANRELTSSGARHQVTVAQLSLARDQLEFKRRAHKEGALSAIELSVAEGDVHRLEAQSQVDSAEIQIQRDRVSYTQLKSPIDGVVLARNVQPGEMVTPGVAAMVDGKPLLVVAQVEKLLGRTELNQMDVARLKMGDKVQVRVDAIADKVFEGEVYRVAAMAQKSERRRDSNLQIFPVDVIVDSKQSGADALRPGMMADITVNVGAHENVLTVPIEALVREGAKAQVRKVTGGGKDALVDVAIGFQNEQVAELLTGVSEGDSVRLKPGDATAQVSK